GAALRAVLRRRYGLRTWLRTTARRSPRRRRPHRRTDARRDLGRAPPHDRRQVGRRALRGRRASRAPRRPAAHRRFAGGRRVRRPLQVAGRADPNRSGLSARPPRRRRGLAAQREPGTGILMRRLVRWMLVLAVAVIAVALAAAPSVHRELLARLTTALSEALGARVRLDGTTGIVTSL